MAASNHTSQEDVQSESLEDEDLLDADEAAEEVPGRDVDGDNAMDSDPDEGADDAEMEIQLQNDSAAHFDTHTDSIFCIARHPTEPSIIATGGGDDITYIWNSTPLPESHKSLTPEAGPGRASIPAIAKLQGHTDSVNCLTYTLPDGAYLITGGLDGKLRAHTATAAATPDSTSSPYPLLAGNQEVPEVNWILPTPHPSYPNTIALGASDGSVWVYSIDASDTASPLQVQQAYYLHNDSCTAGAWTPDGKLLATVSEGGQLYVWDPFGEAAATGVTGTSAGSQAIISLGMEDQRFAVEGGLYSINVAPSGAFLVTGGAGGMIRVVGLPKLGETAAKNATQGLKGGGAKNKSGGGKTAAIASTGAAAATATGQAGQILASLQVQSDGVETLAFAPAPSPLLAAGSVDGSIAIFDTAHRFAVRRHIKEATEDGTAVVKVEFGRGEIGRADGGHLLTSCGMDGVVRRWDTRGGTAAGVGQGLVGQWRGHRGGEDGGILGFVTVGQEEEATSGSAGGGKGRIITAGDEGIALVFET